MKKKTPKYSNKHKKAKEKQEIAIIVGIFLVFIVVVVYLFYFVNIKSSDDLVAVVNGNEITMEELDWWYKLSILPEFRDFITKQDFLVLSLIPQEILVQKADEEDVKVDDDEVEKLLGLFIIENGLTLDEFENHLNSRGSTINEIKKSFEVRAIIIKLLGKENIGFVEGENKNLFFDVDDSAFQEYIDNLIDNSDIEIFPKNIDKLVLKTFEETNDEVCSEEKPIIRLYTTSFCEVCKESGRMFQDLVTNFMIDESIQARHWSLDTGDNLLTLKKENGVPKEEIAIFKKYSPNNRVPTVVLGCKYKHVGKFGIEQEDEFKAIIKTLVGV
jgi:parvulin-like peptidyl-prolyl isomerase